MCSCAQFLLALYMPVHTTTLITFVVVFFWFSWNVGHNGVRDIRHRSKWWKSYSWKNMNKDTKEKWMTLFSFVFVKNDKNFVILNQISFRIWRKSQLQESQLSGFTWTENSGRQTAVDTAEKQPWVILDQLRVGLPLWNINGLHYWEYTASMV